MSDLPGRSIVRARAPQVLWTDTLSTVDTLRHDLLVDRGVAFEVSRGHGGGWLVCVCFGWLVVGEKGEEGVQRRCQSGGGASQTLQADDAVEGRGSPYAGPAGHPEDRRPGLASPLTGCLPPHAGPARRRRAHGSGASAFRATAPASG